MTSPPRSAALYGAYREDRDASKALLATRDKLLAKLLEVQQAHAAEGEAFYPDANGCLRLSAGHVEGYAASDAVVHTPVTTLGGLVDKHLEATLASAGEDVDGVQGGGEFDAPTRLVELCASDPAVAATPGTLLRPQVSPRKPLGLRPVPAARRPHLPHESCRRDGSAAGSGGAGWRSQPPTASPALLALRLRTVRLRWPSFLRATERHSCD